MPSASTAGVYLQNKKKTCMNLGGRKKSYFDGDIAVLNQKFTGEQETIMRKT
jgi:hypothetical protein